jgi:hypothetical protein
MDVSIEPGREKMSDVTERADAAYAAVRRMFEDLNKLGRDFGLELQAQGKDLPESDQYSYSSAGLLLKKYFTWLFHRPPPKELPEPHKHTFAACMVYFEAERGQWKLSPGSQPELWFFVGSITPSPDYRLSVQMPSFFNKNEESRYNPKPSLGTVSIYRHSSEKKPKEDWHVVCLGFGLGEIDSADALKTKAVLPLLDAASTQGLLV